MHDFSSADFVRSILIAITFCVFLAYFYRFVKYFRRLCRGQKLFISAMLMMIVSLAVRAYESITEGATVRWALVPYAIAMILCILHLTEPRHLFERRLGRDIFDEKGPSER